MSKISHLEAAEMIAIIDTLSGELSQSGLRWIWTTENATIPNGIAK